MQQVPSYVPLQSYPQTTYTTVPNYAQSSIYTSTAPTYINTVQPRFTGYIITQDIINQHAQNLFKKYDINNDNQLSLIEVRPMLDEFCYRTGIVRITDDDKAKLFKIFDLDNSRRISFNEFHLMLQILGGLQ